MPRLIFHQVTFIVAVSPAPNMAINLTLIQVAVSIRPMKTTVCVVLPLRSVKAQFGYSFLTVLRPDFVAWMRQGRRCLDRGCAFR